MKTFNKSIFLALIAGMALLAGLFAQSVAAAPGDPPFKPGEIVVAGAPGPHLSGLRTQKYLSYADLTVVEVVKGSEAREVQRFRDQGRRAGLNRLAYATAAPDDTYYYLQWNFPNVQVEEAWTLSDGNGVKAAVLDTGIATGGVDGISCLVDPYNAVTLGVYPEDGDGHGTHVSGTIAQNTYTGIGVSGIAFNACIMPVKVLDDSGRGTFADIAEGIYYAVDHGAAVINMSLGTNARYNLRHDALMDVALDYAEANGVTVVVASGNDGSRKNVSYPAIYPTTIAVGATDFHNGVTRYSNRGDGLDLVAPGGDITRDENNDGYGDGVLQETRIDGEWHYYFFQGTSMATPHVTAAVALLKSLEPLLTPAEVYAALTTTALDLDTAGYDANTGHGLLQIYNALTGDTGEPPPPDGGGDPVGVDADGDGWTADVDCDDNDPNVYPGHQDSKGKWGRDGIDNDCNGVIDG